MSRDYKKAEEDFAISGFFSEYLPPCFRLTKSSLGYSPPKSCDIIPPYCFSMSRFNDRHSRRLLYIPEFGAYIAVRNYIRDNNIFQELIDFTEKSPCSFSPILNDSDTIIRHEQSYCLSSDVTNDNNTSNYINNIAKKLIKASGAKKILKLDIANCFSSFYMHMIPAILLGVETAQEEYKKTINNADNVNPTYKKYANLDESIRRLNQNRTNGLLTGPLYSKLITEAILTRIDIELVDKELSFSRYVDDYEFYLHNEDEESIISIVTKVLKRYGFALNYEKNEILEFPYYIVENLNKLFEEKSKNSLDSQELMKLFNSYLSLEKEGVTGSIKFLLKSIENNPINIQNNELYKAYLLSILSNNDRSLTKVCSILIKNKDELVLLKEDVSNIQKMLLSSIANDHDLEVVWLTYLLLETKHISQDDIEELINSSNELSHILLLRYGNLQDEQLEKLKQKATSWILLYELYSAEFITEETFISKLQLKHNLKVYQKLKEADFHFCC